MTKASTAPLPTCSLEGCTEPVEARNRTSCSPDHRRLLRNASAARYYKKQPRPCKEGLPPKPCRVCGTDFVPYRASSVYCSDLCKDRGATTGKLGRYPERKCHKCEKPLPGRQGHGGKPVCQDCKADPRDPVLQFAKDRRRTLRKYGITQADYDAMLEAQGGRCAICDADAPCKTGRFWRVDHCHATGKVRGLLCNTCNLAIGQMQDDPDRLIAAAVYLERHRGKQ